jgi:two-component system heavy metal sensor histidine kinase CusS
LLTFLVVRHGIEPLRRIAAQTQQMSATHRLTHLHLSSPSLEFSPLVDQFNVLTDRLEASRIQLEAFNSDVAHELRTPLTALIGKTELALSRPRSMEELTQTLASNLADLARMSSMVNDMLFLAHADGGQHARVGSPRDLRLLMSELLEYHELQASERGLQLQVDGDLTAAVDEPLLQRAVSNLLSNACRYAGSVCAWCWVRAQLKARRPWRCPAS